MTRIFPIILTMMLASESAHSGSTNTQPVSMNEQPLRFLALGDSYTTGESVDATDRWPVQLTRLLREEGVHIQDPIIIAKTGWTTDELDAAIDRENPQGVFDVVSLLIGVNNQYRGRSEEEYRIQFRALLTRALGFAGEKSAHRFPRAGTLLILKGNLDSFTGLAE